MKFTGERIVPGADNCEATFAQKMYQEHVARYAFAAQFAPGGDILDVGCGVGYGSQWLARAGAGSVVGIDLADDAIEHARKNYFHPAVTYRALDATAIDLEDAVDLVACFELIEHVDKQEKVLDGIKRALRKDGILVISTPRPLDDIRTHFHHHELNFEELRNLLKERFKHVEVYFERNYFTSFVGAPEPTSIDQIVPVTNRFKIEDADYFIFVASDEKPERFKRAGNLLSINDDSYVLTLENDVAAMRNGENYHLGLIKDLEGRVETDSNARASAEQRMEDAERRAQTADQRAEWIEKIHAETGMMRQDLAALQAALPYAPGGAEAFQQLLADQLAPWRNELERLHQELAASAAKARESGTRGEEITRALQDIAMMAQKLVETESALFLARNDRDMLRAEVEQFRLVQQEFEPLRNSLADHASRLFDAETVRDELASSNREMQAELDRVRTSHSENARRLAEAETEVFFLRNEVGALRVSSSRADETAGELNAVRHQLDQTTAILARFRGSVSWYVTKPVRWIGRVWKKMTGRSAS